MKNVQFEGQTKTKLGNVEARARVESVCTQGLNEFFNTKKNENIGNLIIEKAKGAAKVRAAAKRAKDLTRAKNSIEGSMLLGQMANCTSRNADINELFIVEGDSAGGSAKSGRDRAHQAILPLRGKPLNTEKKSETEVLKNEEIRTIISALGTSFGKTFDISGLKYDKIIILSDADFDGHHTRCILLTFFFRYMKELITKGHIYIGMPPLYKIFKKDVVKYAFNEEELRIAQQEVGRGCTVQRYKGLGEMNPDQLWDTTLNPETRLLTQVTIEEAAEAELLITTLMGDNVEERKKYIQQYADFNKQDEFEIKVKD
jgi:DNA gyrase subunit B